MRYADLQPALDAWSKGENIMSALRQCRGASRNTDEIVEISYDLQAGTYTNYVQENIEYWHNYTRELSTILAPLVSDGASALDVGTGELTTLAGVAPLALKRCGVILACDISFSRIHHGLDFAARHVGPDTFSRVEAFVGSMFELPLADSSVDVVWTSHAIEPNGGREAEAVAEILRVARQWAVLFEPSFEENTAEGRDRMARLGYVRDLPGAVARAGGQIVDRIAIRNVANPLNPTLALICRPRTDATGMQGQAGDLKWSCPATRRPLEKRSGYFYSPSSFLSYPIFERIPLLRPEHGIISSILRR
jgi:ubiquinone/menaquinone biosynthesis C-methylase UbiE